MRTAILAALVTSPWLALGVTVVTLPAPATTQPIIYVQPTACTLQRTA